MRSAKERERTAALPRGARGARGWTRGSALHLRWNSELFFLGFAFAESHDESEKELGCDVLRIVADRSPRSKLGKSAKNKIRLVEES